MKGTQEEIDLPAPLQFKIVCKLSQISDDEDGVAFKKWREAYTTRNNFNTSAKARSSRVERSKTENAALVTESQAEDTALPQEVPDRTPQGLELFSFFEFGAPSKSLPLFGPEEPVSLASRHGQDSILVTGPVQTAYCPDIWPCPYDCHEKPNTPEELEFHLEEKHGGVSRKRESALKGFDLRLEPAKKRRRVDPQPEDTGMSSSSDHRIIDAALNLIIISGYR